MAAVRGLPPGWGTGASVSTLNHVKVAMASATGTPIINFMAGKLPIPPEFESAPSHQRIEFVQELWDRIASDPDRVPVPDEHLRIIDERLRNPPADPESQRPWAEVRAALMAKLRGR
jgi:putative addiction module component (TIGR02574 family)